MYRLDDEAQENQENDISRYKDKKLAEEPHEVAELICLSCKARWIGVYPEKSMLKDAICTCGTKGQIIKTGQSLFEEGK